MSFEDSQNSGTDVSDIDVDAIIANAYGTPSPSSQQSAPEQEVAKPEPPKPPTPKEYEFNYKGQAVKIAETDPRFQKWLSQGYDYSQRFEEFNTARQQFETSKSEWEKNWGVYREIDDYARQNPEWWEKVQSGYQQQRENPLGLPEDVKKYVDERFKPLMEDLPRVKEYLQEQDRMKIEAQNKAEDERLEAAITEVKKKYADIDFSARDESGQSLEQRVLDHGMRNGFQSFTAAFRDYYHDQLEKMAEARGRESAAQELAKRKKLGYLDEIPAPTTSASPARGNGTRTRSWNDPSLSSESILREFKLA